MLRRLGEGFNVHEIDENLMKRASRCPVAAKRLGGRRGRVTETANQRRGIGTGTGSGMSGRFRRLDERKRRRWRVCCRFLRELNHLKRIRVAGEQGLLGRNRMFTRAWRTAVSRGRNRWRRSLWKPRQPDALVATLLAGIDDAVLSSGGVGGRMRGGKSCGRAFDAGGLVPLDAALARTSARYAVGQNRPDFDGDDLCPLPSSPCSPRQPRAGATRPGHPRVVLEPAENHAEHCAVVAVNGVLAAGVFGADPAVPFL